MKESVSKRRGNVKGRVAGKSKTHLAQKLLAWYDDHARLLPWRARPGTISDPYRIYVSEIMLQQTTVATVGPYFQRFIKLYPNFKALSKAPREDILKIWAGLGYYRRAHLMHECAIKVVKEYDGRLPADERTLLTLPGVGRYTAAALTAIAFNRPANVVDGNVERVMARYFAIRRPLPNAKEELFQNAESLLPRERYGDYAQALMDLGATICIPKNPRCSLCPWAQSCAAYQQGKVNQYPYRKKKLIKPKRYGIAFLAQNDRNDILLRRRSQSGLLAGMMEVPSTVWVSSRRPVLQDVLQEAPFKGAWKPLRSVIKHSFTHFNLELSVAYLRLPHKKHPSSHACRWVALKNWKNEGLPSVMRKIVQLALADL